MTNLDGLSGCPGFPVDDAVNRADLFAALVKALGELTDVPKTRTARIEKKSGGEFRYTYADLGDALEMARPILARHDLGVVQPVSTSAKGGVDVATTIIHKSGQSITFGPLTFPTGNTPQETGSAITYARRYSLLAALGLATEEDDDGAAASRGAARRPSQPARQQQAAAPAQGGSTPNLVGLFAALKDAGVPNADRHEWASAALERTVTSFSELTNADLPILLDAAKKRTATRQQHPVADNVVPMPTRPKDEPEGRTWHQELQAIVDGGGKAKFLAWCRAEKATNRVDALSDEQVRKAVMDLGGGS